ncbi:MAG: ParB/RepB/Spo0J family partition protein [Caulobacterales bacterium]
MTNAPRGLGRGLQALLGEPVAADLGRPVSAPQPGSAWATPQAPAPVSAPANVVELPTPAPLPAPSPSGEAGPRLIPMAQIQANPNQPRRTFAQAELSELAESIRARGVLQPILVRSFAGQTDRFEIVAGERRFRAAQMAGLENMPAVVRLLSESEVLEIAIIENVQRVDLNPLEEAMGYQALIDRFGRTQQEIAETVGKSRPHIANTLRLLSLPDDIQSMVREGRLTAGHARAVITAPDPKGLALMAIDQGLNVREVERMAQKAKDERDGPRVSIGTTGSAIKDDDLAVIERSLASALGLPVTITRKPDGGPGEVKIGFRSLADLDGICRRLSSGGTTPPDQGPAF